MEILDTLKNVIVVGDTVALATANYRVAQLRIGKVEVISPPDHVKVRVEDTGRLVTRHWTVVAKVVT